MTLPALQHGKTEELPTMVFPLRIMLLIYEEFGFVKNGENQNPDANNKFVSAYRGKSGIEYGKVYTDTESGKTYVS
ncbi:MAG: hypothetical protein ACLVC1_12825 [Mediterraneibacter gnavus]